MEYTDYYIQDNSDIETQKYNAAKGLYQSGDYKGALNLYLDMQNTAVTSKLYMEIGKCYYKLNDYDNAESYFRNSISIDNYKNLSYIFLGNIFYKKNNLSQAIEYWITANSFKPDDESVCLNLASAYFAKDMKLYASKYYEKYLKYAKDKSSEKYIEIKETMLKFKEIGEDFYKKSLQALGNNDTLTAIKSLEYAASNLPSNFDINHLLGKLYLKENSFNKAEKYLLQAYCTDSKSIDILQKLAQVKLNLEDYAGAYCCFKRIVPLVINNQKIYLDTLKTIKQLFARFKSFDTFSRENIAEKYYRENDYPLALFEYENCVILKPATMEELSEKIDKLKQFITPENEIIKLCTEKGINLYTLGEYQKSNKYFTKVMKLADSSSKEYKLAKSRLLNA